jgi:class 3 adenylate cyclase
MTPQEPGTSPLQGLERKVATILSADVASYSRLMAEDEEGTLRIFRSHREVFEQLVTLHRGRVFNTAGDAILAEFTSAVEAVRCATEIQAALRTRNDQLPPARRVAFRIGVNLGDVMVQDHDLLGDGVNVAARLQAAAQPGGVCVSGSVYDQIRNKLSLAFKSLGEQSFKNIPYPVRTFAITEGEAGIVFPQPAAFYPASALSALKIVATAALLLLGIGGGYWAYVAWQNRDAERARVMSEAAALRREAEQREAQLQAEKQATREAQRRAELEQGAAETARREAQIAADRARVEQALRSAEAETKRAGEEARRLTEELQKKNDGARQAADLRSPSSPRPASAARPIGGAGFDGLYAGRICYGPATNDVARCYRAQGTLADGKITGSWPGRDPTITMILSGEVSASGDVKIEIHGERGDTRVRWATINLSGNLREGKLDAVGSFATNGRSVNLNWQYR